VRRLAILFTDAAFGFFVHHRDAGAIHLHIQNRNAWSHRDRQLQLQGSPELALLTNFDIFSDGFGRTFHGFGGKRQPRQQLQLLAVLLEGNFVADRRQHAAHAGGELRVLDVEFDIDRKLATMAVLTQVVRAQTLGLSHPREHGFGAQLHIAGGVTTGTRQLAVFRTGRSELKQPVQHCRSGLVHAATNRHLDCFQIQRTVLVQDKL